jgi:hypothetical protein
MGMRRVVCVRMGMTMRMTFMAVTMMSVSKGSETDNIDKEAKDADQK